jgi:opine dehydrogenase
MDNSPPMRVAVLGAGAIALGSATLLASRGHVPVLWSPSGAGTAALRGHDLQATGALEMTFRPEIADTCQQAVEGVDAVLIAVPANAYRPVLDTAASVLEAGHKVIFSGHLSFAALYLAEALARRGINIPIAAWGTTAVSGRRSGDTSVRVSSVRAEVDIATIPADAGETMLTLCRDLFGDRFRPRDGLVAIALSNVNPQNHLAIALCNFTRIEHGETWLQNSNITDAVGRLMEALDAERLAIAKAFDVEVRTLRQHFHLSFHTPKAPLADMARALAARGNDPVAPTSPETRYVLEDAPFGLHPTALLGRMCGQTAVLHEAGLALLSAMYGRDLRQANDLLPPLGIAEMTKQQLQGMSQSGWQPA